MRLPLVTRKRHDEVKAERDMLGEQLEEALRYTPAETLPGLAQRMGQIAGQHRRVA